MTKSLIIFLFFIPNAFGFIFNTAFWKGSNVNVVPSNLVLTHSSGNRTFQVSWEAGNLNGGSSGCKLQFLKDNSVWTDLGVTVDCDSKATNLSASFPANNNWTNNFNTVGVKVRIIRISDSQPLGEFPQLAKCSTRGGSSSPTPNIDENCNGRWDDTSSSGGDIVGCSGPTVTGTFAFGTSGIVCNSPPAPCNNGSYEAVSVSLSTTTNTMAYSLYGKFDAPDITCSGPVTNTHGGFITFVPTIPSVYDNVLSGTFSIGTTVTDGYTPPCSWDFRSSACQRHSSYGSCTTTMSIKLTTPATHVTKYVCVYRARTPTVVIYN